MFALHNTWPPGAKRPQAPATHRPILTGWPQEKDPPGGTAAAPCPRAHPHRDSDTSWGLINRGTPLACPRPRDLRACQMGLDLDVRDGSVAVPMVDLDVALTPEVSLEDIAIAVVPPPGAKLPVPGAVQHVEELGVLHADHGEEVLVPEVATEVVLVGQLLYLCGLQQAAVEGGLAHGLQVQQHHSTVEAREPLGRGAPNPCLGVLVAELPECVPGKGKESKFNLVCVGETVCRPYFPGWSQPAWRETLSSLQVYSSGDREVLGLGIGITPSARGTARLRPQPPDSKPQGLPTILCSFRMTSLLTFV